MDKVETMLAGEGTTLEVDLIRVFEAPKARPPLMELIQH